VTLSPTEIDSPEEIDFPFEFIPGGVDPRALKIHKNVRIDPRVESDREFLDSIRRRGVRTAIAAYRDAAGDLVVLRGQRRTLAAVLVGRARVPVMVEPEPTEADRIADQVVENDQRAGLVAQEHMLAYEEMALIGLTAEQIAEMAAAPAPRVKAALTASRLSAKAREVVERVPNVDLLQVAALEEFDGDDEAIAKLTECIASGSGFDFQVKRLRIARADAEMKTAAAAEWSAKGYHVADDSPSFADPVAATLGRLKKSPKVDMTSALHKKCPGRSVSFYVQLGQGDERVLKSTEFCSDWKKHGHTLQDWAARSAGIEQEKTPEQRAKESADLKRTKKFNALARTAAAVRWEHLRRLADLKKAPAGVGLLVATALTADHTKVTWTMQRSSKTAHKLLGVEPKQYGLADDFTALADNMGRERGEVLAMMLVLAAYEESFDQASWRVREGWMKRYLAFLESTGYELSDVEKIAAGRLTVEQYERTESESQAAEAEALA
jgi:ParB family chromosome partitioning protein